jgi:hypothetical protein
VAMDIIKVGFLKAPGDESVSRVVRSYIDLVDETLHIEAEGSA